MQNNLVINDSVMPINPHDFSVSKIISENESIYINSGVKHRLENPTKEIISIIEVQTGTYLGEDDIIRYDDDYKRLSSD